MFDGADGLVIADGFHRFEAASRTGATDIECEVRPGSMRDAALYACSANASHGLRRTNADKRKAVTRLLLDSEWGAWTDRQIAQAAGVSNNFVSTLRRELEEAGQLSFDDNRRKGKDGKNYQPRKPRKSAPTKPEPQPEPDPEPEPEPALPDPKPEPQPLDAEVALIGEILIALSKHNLEEVDWEAICSYLREHAPELFDFDNDFERGLETLHSQVRLHKQEEEPEEEEPEEETPRARAKKPDPRRAAISDVISEAYGIFRELGEEMRNWADSMPENLQNSPKHDEITDTADTLERLADQEPPSTVEANVTVQDPTPRRRGYSRPERLGHAVYLIETVVTKLEEIGGEEASTDLVNTLNELKEETDGVCFPGMMG